MTGKTATSQVGKTGPVKVPADEANLSSFPTEEQDGDGGAGFRLLFMQFSLSDLKLKDSVDTLKSMFNSFVHNMPKIQVICCIFNFWQSLPPSWRNM